jgi:hypothetical protein
VLSLFRVLWAILVAGGLAAIGTYVYRRRSDFTRV